MCRSVGRLVEEDEVFVEVESVSTWPYSVHG